jgi:hypothetical protein
MRFEKRTDELLTSTLVEEFSLIFNMYEEAIETIPENQWKNGEIEYLIPARLIFHAIEAADYYTPDNLIGYLWKKRFDIDPDAGEIPVEKLPTKQYILEYHRETQSKIRIG